MNGSKPGAPELAAIASERFDRMRGCGADVAALLHDGQPTACVGAAAFGYVSVFSVYVQVGFFQALRCGNQRAC